MKVRQEKCLSFFVTDPIQKFQSKRSRDIIKIFGQKLIDISKN